MQLGAVIPDGGLRLGLIEQWIEADTLPGTDVVFDAAVAAIRGDDSLWFEEKGAKKLDLDEPSNVDDILQHAVDAFAKLEVDEQLFDQVTQLQFDGGNDVYCELIVEALATRLGCESWELDTGGETEVFCVRSLEGIAKLTKLESLNLDGHGYIDGGHDLSPLANHPSLDKLTLTGVAAGAEALTTLGALKTVSGTRGISDDMKAQLTAKGVSVS